jgi:hypothetical protein
MLNWSRLDLRCSACSNGPRNLIWRSSASSFTFDGVTLSIPLLQEYGTVKSLLALFPRVESFDQRTIAKVIRESSAVIHLSFCGDITFRFLFLTEIQNCDSVKIKFETLHTMDSSDTIDIDSHMSDRASVSSKNAADSDNIMMITPELLGLMPSGSSGHSESGENNSRGHTGQSSSHHHGSKSWTQEDMDAALDALRNHDMSLTKASGK